MSAEEKPQLENQLPGQGAAGDVDNRMRLTGEPDTAPGTRGTLVTPTLYYQYTESPNQAKERWRKQPDENSYHSAIPGNPDHAAGVTAYDLSLGKPYPALEKDKDYLEYLRTVADWRTDWKRMVTNKDPIIAKILKLKDKEATKLSLKDDKGITTTQASDLIDATLDYYNTGVLPADIAAPAAKPDDDEIVKIKPPSLIVSYTVGERLTGHAFPGKSS